MGKKKSHKKKAIAIKKPTMKTAGVQAKATKKTLVQIHNSKRMNPTV